MSEYIIRNAKEEDCAQIVTLIKVCIGIAIRIGIGIGFQGFSGMVELESELN